MALSSGSSSDLHESLDTLPTFDLTFRYDDATNPAELTVFPAAETDGQTTAWLTIDVEHAVPLETIR